MRIAEITVTTGTPERGWCDTCLTSARIAIGMYVISEDGPALIGTVSGCSRCKTGMYAPGGALADQ